MSNNRKQKRGKHSESKAAPMNNQITMNEMELTINQDNSQPVLFGISISDWINIVIAFFTFISVIGVFITLREMQIERDTAYMPSIAINPVTIQFECDENISNDIPLFERTDLYFSVINVGNGTARNISFSWDKNNTKRLNDYLVQCNENKNDFCYLEDKYVLFNRQNRHERYSYYGVSKLMYMKTDDEPYALRIPEYYIILIEELLKQPDYKINKQPPYLILNAKFQDVQGKSYSKKICIQVDRQLLEELIDGSQKVVYQLIPS